MFWCNWVSKPMILMHRETQKGKVIVLIIMGKVIVLIIMGKVIVLIIMGKVIVLIIMGKVIVLLLESAQFQQC